MQKLNKKIRISLTGCLLMTVFLLVGCSGGNDLQVSLQETGEGSTEPVMEENGQMNPETVNDAEETNTPETANDSAPVNTPEAANDSAPVNNPETVGGAEPTDRDSIYVQVTGAVRVPGVYELPAGSRVFEAVEKAGGMLDEAEPSAVNQALSMTDGQMIYIYTKEEWKAFQESGDSRETLAFSESSGAGGTAESEKDGRVNINTADKEQLCTIPGIGETRAESILTYRQEHGNFSSIEDIKKVNGIKDGLFQKIKDKIKV